MAFIDVCKMTPSTYDMEFPPLSACKKIPFHNLNKDEEECYDKFLTTVEQSVLSKAISEVNTKIYIQTLWLKVEKQLADMNITSANSALNTWRHAVINCLVNKGFTHTDAYDHVHNGLQCHFQSISMGTTMFMNASCNKYDISLLKKAHLHRYLYKASWAAWNNMCVA